MLINNSEYSQSFIRSLPPMLQYLINWEKRNDAKFFSAYHELSHFEFYEYVESISNWLSRHTQEVSNIDMYKSVYGNNKAYLVNAISIACNRLVSDIDSRSVADILSTLENKGFPQMHLFHGTAFRARAVTSGFRNVYSNPLRQERVDITQWFGEAIIRCSPFLPLQELPYLIAYPMTEIIRTMETYPHLSQFKIENLQSISYPTFTFNFLHAPQNAMMNILSKTKVFAHPQA
ncbi:MAG: hypothetical protein Q7R95_09810 [bacterium]|nr:hypothetical protein [bacterium]